VKSILVSKHGRVFGLAADDSVIAGKGLRIGDFPRQWLVDGPQHVATTDDFDGQVLSTRFGVAKGSDGSCTNFVIDAALNGMARGVSGAGATLTMAVNGVQLSGALNFQANSGDLEFATRVKLSSTANIAVFVGLTNQSAALQMPMNGAGGGDGFTATAANCVGFLYDTTMTTKHWWGVAANASTAAAGQDAGIGPTATDYDDMYINVDASGNVGFYLNGAPVGTLVQAALAANVPLTPVIAAFSRAATAVDVDADYLHAGCRRV
jgi:hypothetical protein